MLKFSSIIFHKLVIAFYILGLLSKFLHDVINLLSFENIKNTSTKSYFCMLFPIKKGCIKGCKETNVSDKLNTACNLKEDI